MLSLFPRLFVILTLIFVAMVNAHAEVYPMVISPGDTNATIATDDSIAFSTMISGTVYTYLNCGAYGTPFRIKPGQQATLPFKKPGFYSAVVKDDAGLEIAAVKISVVKALLTPRADQVGFTRVADFHVLPNASLVTFRSNNTSLLDVIQTGQTGEVAHLNILAKARGDLRVQAVIQSPAGPRVIGEARINEFTIDTPSLYETLIDATSEIGTSQLTMHPFAPNVIVTFTMFAHRSTFAAGVKTFTVSSNLFTKKYNPVTKETDGVFLFDIEMPTDENRYCLAIYFSQANSDPVPIGASGAVNGSGCKVTVDSIVMAANSGGKDLVVTVTESAPNGGTKHAITIVASAGRPTEAVFNENKQSTSNSMIDCTVKGSQVKLRVLPGKVGKYYDVQIEQTIFSKRITVVDIVFSKNEVRPGIPAKWHATVNATITPSDYTAFFTSSAIATATVSPNNGVGTVALAVAGVKLSGGNQDTKIQGRLESATGDIVRVLPITVVEPSDYQSTPTATDSKPTLVPPTTVQWQNNILITIKDQFGIILQDNWNGLIIDENAGKVRFVALPSPVTNGIVTDPVIGKRDYAAAPPPGGVIYATEIVAGTRPAGGVISNINLNQDLRAKIEAGNDKVIGPVNKRTNTLDGPASSWTTTNSH